MWTCVDLDKLKDPVLYKRVLVHGRMDVDVRTSARPSYKFGWLTLSVDLTGSVPQE